MVLIHSYAWFRLFEPNGTYWVNCEREFHEFATFYGLPEISVKAAAWDLMRTGVERRGSVLSAFAEHSNPIQISTGVRGFDVSETRGSPPGFLMQWDRDGELKGKVFYWDIIHPDGQTGHKFMGEISAQVGQHCFIV